MRIYRYGCDWCADVYTSNNEESAKLAADECCKSIDEYFESDEAFHEEADC